MHTNAWMAKIVPASSAVLMTAAQVLGERIACMSTCPRSIPTHEYSSPLRLAFSTSSTGLGISTYETKLGMQIQLLK